MEKSKNEMEETVKKIAKALEDFNSGIEIPREKFSGTQMIDAYMDINDFSDADDFMYQITNEKEKIEKKKNDLALELAWDDEDVDLNDHDLMINLESQFKYLADKIEELLAKELFQR